MTKSLEAAIQRLRTLSEEEQEFYAQRLLDEMDADDAKWNATTAKHADAVERLAAEVTAAYERGECEPLDPDKL